MSRASSKNTTSCGECGGELRRGPWTFQEDTLLVHYVASCGQGNWNLLAKRSGLKRTGKSCRLRWLNYLKPDVKRGNLSPQEQLLILQLHSRWGNRWSKIAQELPGRTDNEIKNYWRTRIHKQARHLKMDTNSPAFRDIIRCLWIPRLLQKIQHSSPDTCTSPILSQNPIDLHSLDPESGAPQQVTQSMNQHEYQVYSDQSSASSSITCSDPMNMFQASDNPCTATIPFHSMEPGCNNIEFFENPIDQSVEMVNSNWVCDDFSGDGLWGLDELWQFRNID